MKVQSIIGCFALLLYTLPAKSAQYPAPTPGDFTIHDFHFNSGETFPELKMHYITLGAPATNASGTVTNAVIILHGTTGNCSNFINPAFGGELFGAGQLLDATHYYIIIPDNLGHGHSTKPSDGLRAKFPSYGYKDMVLAQYRLVTEGLKVNHLRLVMGTSMGGMHSWVWGETYPDFMDALMPLASQPGPMSGRNRMWRRVIIDSIRNDPAYDNGNYTGAFPGLRTAVQIAALMAENPILRQKEAPTLSQADRMIDNSANAARTTDANDFLYAYDASHDYDPAPGLEKIKAPLIAVNSADDLINPPELKVLENGIKRVAHGQAIVIPLSDQTRGHGSHSIANLWKNYLAELLQESAH
jgi:homoserine O-acetyltransferase/O-succinyltransferase